MVESFCLSGPATAGGSLVDPGKKHWETVASDRNQPVLGPELCRDAAVKLLTSVWGGDSARSAHGECGTSDFDIRSPSSALLEKACHLAGDDPNRIHYVVVWADPSSPDAAVVVGP